MSESGEIEHEGEFKQSELSRRVLTRLRVSSGGLIGYSAYNLFNKNSKIKEFPNFKYEKDKNTAENSFKDM